ncbi:protease pro-enzyme activation domain-containing protein [Actinoplanes sp. NPDC051859]|uniref:S53 family peptidase n=1 Tax=Actinoplanes sp. NPDC051859 TaxID=3363909 RepID=UPI0037B7EDD8
MHIRYLRFAAAGIAVSLLALSTPAIAAPVVPGGGSTVAPNEPVTLTLTLAGAKPADVERSAVAAVGGKAHRFLDRRQLRKRFGASPARVARVTSWARNAGFSVGHLDSTGTRLTIHGTARTATAALDTRLQRVTVDGVTVRAAASPARLPAPVASDVLAVSGLTQQVARPLHVRPRQVSAAPGCVPALASSRPTGNRPCATSAPKARPAAGSSGTGRYCNTYWGQWNADVPQKYGPDRQSNQLCGYNGAQLRSLYGLTPSDTGAGQTVVIVGAYDNATTLADANKAFVANGVPALPADRYQVKRYPTTPTAGVDCDQNSWHLEQALDVQTVHTIAPAARIVYVPAADCTQLEEALAQVIGDASLDASIVSNSWSMLAEPDPAASTATNSMLARATILGIGTYFASGDYGDTSTLPGGRAGNVSFPASSPWVTAVGGTTAALGADNKLLWQTGWENAGNTLTGGQWQRLNPAFIGGAGGGASAYVTKPTWQSTLSGNKRMVPDVSALADPYTGFSIGTTTNGTFQTGPVGGTSLATPIVASLAALAQAKAGPDTNIGLLAPVLYAKAGAGRSALADVTHVAAGIWTPGISADLPPGDYLVDVDAGVQPSLTTRPGYDAATGLGVPGRTFLTDVVS